MSNDEKMRQAIQKVYANLEARDDGVIELPAGTPLHMLGKDGCKYALAAEGGDYEYLCEMANKWKRDTLLPMNIWIDEQQTYVHGGHSKRIKFQLDKSSKLNPRNYGTMDLNGGLHPSNLDIGELHTGDLTQLRNFVHNNKYALEHVADMEIWISQIWEYMIMGGERASDEAIAALNRKVDEIMADNNLRSTVQVRPRPAAHLGEVQTRKTEQQNKTERETK